MEVQFQISASHEGTTIPHLHGLGNSLSVVPQHRRPTLTRAPESQESRYDTACCGAALPPKPAQGVSASDPGREPGGDTPTSSRPVLEGSGPPHTVTVTYRDNGEPHLPPCCCAVPGRSRQAGHWAGRCAVGGRAAPGRASNGCWGPGCASRPARSSITTGSCAPRTELS